MKNYIVDCRARISHVASTSATIAAEDCEEACLIMKHRITNRVLPFDWNTEKEPSIDIFDVSASEEV